MGGNYSCVAPFSLHDNYQAPDTILIAGNIPANRIRILCPFHRKENKQGIESLSNYPSHTVNKDKVSAQVQMSPSLWPLVHGPHYLLALRQRTADLQRQSCRTQVLGNKGVPFALSPE